MINSFGQMIDIKKITKLFRTQQNNLMHRQKIIFHHCVKRGCYTQPLNEVDRWPVAVLTQDNTSSSGGFSDGQGKKKTIPSILLVYRSEKAVEIHNIGKMVAVVTFQVVKYQLPVRKKKMLRIFCFVMVHGVSTIFTDFQVV